MLKKRIISLIILSSMLASFASCGDSLPSNDKDPAGTGSDQTSADTSSAEPEYVFPKLDCGNETFNILNPESIWGMYTYLDFDQQTGDQLDDAVYIRNRKIEDQFNVKLNVINVPLTELAAKVRQSAQSNDSLYDAAYVEGDHIASLITDGLLVDLTTVTELQLDKNWWNQNVNESAKIGDNDSIFFAVSDLSLAAFDLTWCIMFNEDMTEKLGLDKPYDLVRNGKWTLDALKKYAASGANLNGDESFSWNKEGNSVYGFTSYYNIFDELFIGAGCRYIEKKEGALTLGVDNDRFYSFCEKISSIVSTAGEYMEANNGNTGMHYEQIFKNRRALFVGAEIKASKIYRDFEDTFGIIPAPKFDEAQKEYYSWITFAIPMITIPKDCANVERAGVIIDALSYLSTKDVLPKYYDIAISQKGLRNEDSIEMFGIIRDSRVFEASLAYGWTIELNSALLRQIIINKGDPNTASLVAKNKDKINAKIQATLDLVNAE